MLKILITLMLLTGPALADGQEVDLGDRHYVIHLPDGVRNPPLIMALHGGGGDPDQFASASGLGRDGMRAGYAVIFPAGTGRRGDRLLTWNGGYCCGPAAKRGVDDLGFLAAVIKDAGDRFGVDTGRVYFTGMSNGSIMAETFAAKNPGKVKAVAGISGTMDVARTRVGGPVPILIIHGTADEMVPYTGGQGDSSLTRTDFASVASVVKAFAAPWPGPLAKTSRQIDAKDDGTSVTITDYSSKGRIVLRLETVEGGAHHWPGGHKARLTSGKTEEISANAELLRFFALHP
jgi:polyhydroxybutyrate depolymerase